MLVGSDGRTLFVTANRYSETGASDGVVLTERVAVPRAGARLQARMAQVTPTGMLDAILRAGTGVPRRL